MADIRVSESENGKAIVIFISDRFDFNALKKFRASYQGKPPVSEYVINLSDVSYMDSSALGMILLLREHALNHNSKVSIVGCSGEIKKILTTANFHRLFDIQ